MSNLIEVFSVVGYGMYDAVGNPPNAHHGYQLFYNLKGKSVFEIGKKKFSLNEGECIIVPPFAMHTFLSSLGTKPSIIDIRFTVRDVEFDKKVRNISTVVFPQDSMLEDLIKMIVLEERRRSGNFYYTVRNLVETFLLISIDRNQWKEPVVKDAIGQDFEQLSECTKRVVRFLEGMATGNRKFDLDLIAKGVGYSKQYFCQMFINEVGMTVKQYLMTLRVEKAKELIDNTDYTVKEISELLNFNSYAYFGRMFKNYAGMTPVEYRNRPVEYKQYLIYSFRDSFEIGRNEEAL